MDSELFDRLRRRLDAMESYAINNSQLFNSYSGVPILSNSCSYIGYPSQDEETTGEVGSDAENCDSNFRSRNTENSGLHGNDCNYSETLSVTNSNADGSEITRGDSMEERRDACPNIRRDVSLLSSSSSVCSVESRIEAGRQAFDVKSIFEKYRRGNIVAASKFSMLKSEQEYDDIISIPSSICESSIDEESVNSLKDVGTQHFGLSSNYSNYMNKANPSNAHIPENPQNNPKKPYPFVSPSSERTPKKNNVNLRVMREMHGHKLNTRIDEIANYGNGYDESSFSSAKIRGSKSMRQDRSNASKVSLSNSTLAKAKQNKSYEPTKCNEWNLSKGKHGGVEPDIYISTSSLTASTTDLTDVTSPSADCNPSCRSSFDDCSLIEHGDQSHGLRSSSSSTTSLRFKDEIVNSYDGKVRGTRSRKHRDEISNPDFMVGANGYKCNMDRPHTRNRDVFEEEFDTPKLITTVNRVHCRSFDFKEDSPTEDDDEVFGPITTPRLLQKIESLFASIEVSETPDIEGLETVDEEAEVTRSDSDEADDGLAPVEEYNVTMDDRVEEQRKQNIVDWNKQDGLIHPRAVLEPNRQPNIEQNVDNESQSEETIERLTSNAYFSSLLRENGSDKCIESKHEDSSVLFTNPPHAPKHERSKHQGSTSVNYVASTSCEDNDAQNSYSARGEASNQPFTTRATNHQKNTLDSSDEYKQIFKATQHYCFIPAIEAGANTDDFCVEILASPSEDDSLSTISRNTFCSATISSKKAQSLVDSVVRRLVAEEIERMVQSGASKEDIEKMLENRKRLEDRVKRMMRESDVQSRQIEPAEEMVEEEISRKYDIQSVCSYGRFALHEAGISHCNDEKNSVSTLEHLENMRDHGADSDGCLETALIANDGDSFAKAARAFESWYGHHMELIESILQSKQNKENAKKILLLKSSTETAMKGMSKLKQEFLRKRKDLCHDNDDSVYGGDHRARSMLLSSDCTEQMTAKRSHFF